MPIFLPVIVLSVLAILFGSGLAWAGKVFAVETDPRIEAVREALPGANCGACGYPGCNGLADAIVAGTAPITGCPVGGEACAKVISTIVGGEVEALAPKIATILCQGATDTCKTKYDYTGVLDCRAAALASGGPKSCRYACIGMGTCANNCPFHAIEMRNGIAYIHPDKCTGCGTCVSNCPKNVIRLEPTSRKVAVLCRASEKGKAVRDACTSGCIACGKCFKTCQFGAITLVDNLPRIDYDLCTQCMECSRACPTGAMWGDPSQK